MKSSLGRLIITVVVILIAVYLYSRFGPAIPISSVVTQKQDQFSATGEGRVSATPDLAIVSLGVQIRRDTVTQAQDEANSIMNAVNMGLAELGIDKKDIQTTNYNIFPEYNFGDGANRGVLGYSVNSNFEVKIRDFSKVNQVIDISTQAGANQVGGLVFTFGDELKKDLQNQAREKAVADAKEKAGNLARIAGLNLGRLINVQEISPTGFPALNRELDLSEGMGGAPTQVQPGEGELVVNITLTYETR